MASITKQTTYFSQPGPENTDMAIKLAVGRAKEGDIKKVVVASSSGDTGIKAINAFKGMAEVVPVVLSAGSKWSGGKEWQENKAQYEKRGVKYVKGIQAFSGVERAINERWGTVGPVMLISDALRLPCEGFKVAVEIVLMACDAGFVDPGENVLAIAGTSRGADTVLVVRAAYSHKFFDIGV
ncbi:MAG: pyruvate kinase alpha/beta domain-containing protein, partial [Candidatus Woesearchaeota archaeon]